ncbi:hypothetical protein [Nitrospirillum iridis]|uniref:Uncharacterized protein n=1 Tax=Nitrospirillum iridis TaxID=765888 RepID=A0A7X0AU40_9PROT|nr:hypothetical protein [Nitrospirillum iridis]MBB6250133.1 hypothetical protein [Nitrospirillum iridis]
MNLRFFVVMSVLYIIILNHSHARSGEPKSANTSNEKCQGRLDIAYAALYGTVHLTDILSNDAPIFPLVLDKGSDGNFETVPLKEKSDFWKIGWKGKSPAAEMIHLSYSTPYRSLVKHCIQDHKKTRPVGSLLSDRYKFYTPTVAPYFTSYGPLEVKVTDPIVNSEGTQALIFYSVAEIDGIGGSNGIVFLKVNENKWDVVGRRILSVS